MKCSYLYVRMKKACLLAYWEDRLLVFFIILHFWKFLCNNQNPGNYSILKGLTGDRIEKHLQGNSVSYAHISNLVLAYRDPIFICRARDLCTESKWIVTISDGVDWWRWLPPEATWYSIKSVAIVFWLLYRTWLILFSCTRTWKLDDQVLSEIWHNEAHYTGPYKLQCGRHTSHYMSGRRNFM